MTEIQVIVTARETMARDVVALRLASVDDGDLPEWEPGAHIDLVLPDGVVRQYSLCGDPSDRSTYRLGILREGTGRGGSVTIHDNVVVGTRLALRGPRNHFALDAAEEYIFIAGGIGITPILPMLARARATGTATTVLYGGRTRESMAFLDEVLLLNPDARIRPQDEVGLLDLQPVIDLAGAGTAIYCCGPEPLLAAVENAGAHLKPGSVHVERFAAAVRTEIPSGGFRVELRQSRLNLDVESGQSILEAVTEAGVDVLSSCEDGVCGTCLTSVLSGDLVHRDSVLGTAERSAGDKIAICVSRAVAGSSLVLDL